MASACALAMFSGKIILNFGVQKRLRAFLNPIFTGRGRDGKRQLPRWFPAETIAWRANSPSLAALDSPLWDGAFGMVGKFPAKAQSLRHARGSLSEGAGKTVRF